MLVRTWSNWNTVDGNGKWRATVNNGLAASYEVKHTFTTVST